MYNKIVFTGGYNANGTVTRKVSSYMMRLSWHMESFQYKDWFDKIKHGKAISLNTILWLNLPKDLVVGKKKLYYNSYL